MKFSAQLDVNVVAHETADEVAVLLDLVAPEVAPAADRPTSSLQVVLDRSGSMSGAPLAGAKQALVALVHRLEPTDNFGLVVFDDTAEVVVPAGPLTDKTAVVERIASVDTGGMTDLSAGYVRGVRELRRVTGAGGTLLVVSDGHANAGITDPERFASLAASGYGDGVVTSTLGYGEKYDETLLAAVARAGNGNHEFAADPDAAGAAIAREVDGLLDKVVQAATLTVSVEPMVQMLALYNDLPAQQLADGAVMVEVGDFWSGEERRLLLRLSVPALAGLGVAQVATLQLQYVELPGLVEHTVTLPVSVNVVPGDEAVQRVPDPLVRSEVLFQEAQASKKQASEAFERGDDAGAHRHLGVTRRLLDRASEIAPEPAAAAIHAELSDVGRMSALAEEQSSAFMSKMTRSSYHAQNRKRGRVQRTRTGGAPMQDLPSELAERFSEHGVDPRIQDLVAYAARHRSLTGGNPHDSYVSVRPSAWGTICAYVHREYVDLALSPGSAAQLHRRHGIRILKENGTTAFVQVRAEMLDDPVLRDLARQWLLEAVDKSEAGTAYEGDGAAGRREPGAGAETCPVHHTLMFGGRCDECE